MWSGLCVLSHGGSAASGVVPWAPARMEAVMRRGLRVVVLAVLAGAMGMAGIAGGPGEGRGGGGAGGGAPRGGRDAVCLPGRDRGLLLGGRGVLAAGRGDRG